MFQVENLVTGYGNTIIAKGVSFEVKDNEIVGLLGLNGAGKTTLARAIAGTLPISKGTIRIDGVDVTRLSAFERARKGIGLVSGDMFPDLSVRENLQVGVSSFEREGSDPDILELFPVLKNRMNQKAGTLSGGERRMLSLARGLFWKPKILIVDEPSAGLAPKIVLKILETLGNIRERGQVMLLIEQNAQMISALAQRAYVLRDGQIAGEFSGTEVNSDKVRSAIFGQ